MTFVRRYACGDHTEGNEKTENPGNSVADVANAWACLLKGGVARRLIQFCHDGECSDLEYGMKEHKTGNSSPNSSSPRMCADPKYDAAQRKRRTPYSKLRDIACASPCDAKRTVLLVTVIFDLVGKDTTLEIRVLKLSPIGPRDSRYLLFAAFGESIRNGDFCAEELWTVYNKPVRTHVR